MKTCLACNKPLKGRIDKKFCDDYCRNSYNNRLNSDSNNFVRNVNNTLRKNRRILQELLSHAKTTKTTRLKLLEKGFRFKYFTNTYINRNGTTYFFCYEYGYLPLEGEWLLVVKQEDEMVT
jgi:hypothetical protein